MIIFKASALCADAFYKLIKSINQEDINMGEKMTIAHNVEREENLTRPLNHHKRTEQRIIPGCSQVEKKLQEL